MLLLLATYAVLLICWSLAMRAGARRWDAEGASDAAEGLAGADPWAERGADGAPAGNAPGRRVGFVAGDELIS